MYWIFSVKFVDLGDSCMVGGDTAMNIIIAQVPVPNVPELKFHKITYFEIFEYL